MDSTPISPHPPSQHDLAPILHALQRWTDADLDLLILCTTHLLADIPHAITALHSALSTNDATALQAAAHTLKGTLAHCGVPHLHQLAAELESHGRTHALTQAAPLLARLEEGLACFTQQITAIRRQAQKAL